MVKTPVPTTFAVTAPEIVHADEDVRMDLFEVGPAGEIRHRGIVRVLAPISLRRRRVAEIKAQEVEALFGDHASEIGDGEFLFMDMEEHVPAAVEVIEILPSGADGDRHQIVAGHGVPAKGPVWPEVSELSMIMSGRIFFKSS